MYSIRFWENWVPEFNQPFKFFGLAIIVLTIFLMWAVWISPAPTVTWQFWQEREVTEVPVHQFQTGPFSLQVSADNIVLFENLLGNDFDIQTWPVYLYLPCILLGLILLISILSTLSRFWFFIGSGLIIFLITSLQLELLYVLGQSNKLPAIFLMVVVIGTGLLFQYYFQAASFINRLATFTATITGSFALLAILSEAPAPVIYIAVGFIPASIVLTVLLAIFTAHEILATIIYLITRGLKGSNGFAHFLILSLIYLTNLVAVYLGDKGWFRWDYSINPVLLIILSATLGIWGIRRQQEQTEDFLLAGPLGPMAIMALLMIALGSSVFFYATGNDAAVETIRNMSLYAHMGFGGIFILYVISNFSSFLRNNYPVIKVLYKPTAMPFFTFRFAGTIAMLAFIFYNFWKRPINDTKGARYAAMGDYYMTTGNIPLAEGFYKNSDFYAFHNHHANFMLANLEHERGNAIKERQYYLNAAERRPTQQAYMNAINTLDQTAINLYAYLKNVQHDFPESGAANTVLGLVYARLNQLDSSLYFFNLAKKDPLTTGTAEINLLATAVKQNLNLNVDSIYQSLDGDEPGPISNAFAFANNKRVTLDHELTLTADSTLNLFTSSLISNYLLNHRDSLDTAVITQAVKLARRPSNIDYFETVMTACAHACYKSGQVNRAFKLMQEATVYSQAQGRNNNIMALWALDQMAPTVALDYVQFAVYQNYSGALLTKAIALAEAGIHGEAIVLFDSLRKVSPGLVPMAESVQRVLAVDKKLVSRLNDMEKYAFCRYRLGYEDSIAFNSISSSIENADWKGRTILDRSKNLLAWDELQDAIRVYNRLNGIAMSDRNLFEDIQRHELLMLAANGNMDLIQSKMESGIQWKPGRQCEKIYFEALLDLKANDTLRAKEKLNWLGKQNAYFPQGVLAGAVYAKQNQAGKLDAYTLLANAVQMNPKSAKLLKAFILEANALGFDEFANSSKETLREVLPASLYKKFMATIP